MTTCTKKDKRRHHTPDAGVLVYIIGAIFNCNYQRRVPGVTRHIDNGNEANGAN